MWWNVSNPYRSFGKQASKEKHCGVGRKMILTVRLKFGRIRIVEVKRYHFKPGRPSVMDPAQHPHGGPGRWKSGSPGMPGRARSAFCDRPKLRHRRTSPWPAGRFCHRKCRGQFCRWIKMQNCRVRQTHAQKTWINIVDLKFQSHTICQSPIVHWFCLFATFYFGLFGLNNITN